MTKLQKVGRYGLMYLGWAAVVALAVWLGLLAREALTGLVAVTWVGRSFLRSRQVAAVDRFYLVGLGIAWIALMIGSEQYFRTGLKRGRLYPRLAGFLGAELVLIAAADAVRILIRVPAARSGMDWAVIGAEAAIGAALAVSAWRAARRIRAADLARVEAARRRREG